MTATFRGSEKCNIQPFRLKWTKAITSRRSSRVSQRASLVRIDLKNQPRAGGPLTLVVARELVPRAALRAVVEAGDVAKNAPAPTHRLAATAHTHDRLAFRRPTENISSNLYCHAAGGLQTAAGGSAPQKGRVLK